MAHKIWIIDTSVWIDHFHGKTTPQTTLLNQYLGRQKMGLGDLILCELLQGFRHQADYVWAKSALEAFPVYPLGGEEIAFKAAENYRALRQKGFTIRKTIDCFIATFVIEAGFQLLHNDRDFDPFEQHLGLNVVQ